MYDRTKLTWREQSDGTLALHAYGLNRAILNVVPDTNHSGMWRIRHLDGRRSDMVNPCRAKDAGILHGMAIMNRVDAA